MQIDEGSGRPIFLQIAEGIEDAILAGAFPEGGQIPSITEFSVSYTINPATALKGITLLVDGGILYKKRGVGMFVAEGAAEKLRAGRREQFYGHHILPTVAEARRLGIGHAEVEALVARGFAESPAQGAAANPKADTTEKTEASHGD